MGPTQRWLTPGKWKSNSNPRAHNGVPSKTSLSRRPQFLTTVCPKTGKLFWKVNCKPPFSPSGPTNLTASAASLKHVIRPGSLQDQSGPSIATEFGVLLPDSTGSSNFGASIDTIVSQRWDWGTVHLNIAGGLTRDQRAAFTDLIIEGPSKWVVRPVAEVFYEEEFGRAHTLSALVGAIWRVSDKLSFDVGFRHAITNGSNVNEIRAGLTVGFQPQQLGSPNHK
jgi:hypothetical protein